MAMSVRSSRVPAAGRSTHCAQSLRLAGRGPRRAQVSTRSAASASATAVSTYVRDPELQAAIDALFAETIDKGRRRVPHSEVQSHVDRISQLGSSLGLNRVRPEWNDGGFCGVLTTQLTGITEDNNCNMARLTFGRVGPPTLMVQTDQFLAANTEGKAEQWKGPLAAVAEDPAHGYCVRTFFRLIDADVLGCMLLNGLYDIDPVKEGTLGVTFTGFRLQPARPSDPEDVRKWREALGPHNQMDEAGGIDVVFEKRARYTLNYILMDPEWHLALGGSGSLTCMKAVPGDKGVNAPM